MHWLIYSFIAAVLYSTTIIIDKHLLDRRLKNVSAATVTALAGLAGLPFLGILIALQQSFPTKQTLIYGTLAGWLIMLGYQLYYVALKKSDASLVTTLFQLILPFNYFFGLLFFDERLTLVKLVGLLIISCGVTIVTMEQHESKWQFRKDTFAIMLVASLCVSMSDVVFKKAVTEDNFVSVAITEYASSVAAGILLFIFSKNIRRQLKTLRGTYKKLFAIGQTNEILTLSATFALRYALILGPLALVQGVLSTQPLLVMLMSGLLAFLFPRLRQHKKRSKKRLIAETIATILVIIGSALIVGAN